MKIHCHHITILLKWQSYNEIYNFSSHILKWVLACFNLGYRYITKAIIEIRFGILQKGRIGLPFLPLLPFPNPFSLLSVCP